LWKTKQLLSIIYYFSDIKYQLHLCLVKLKDNKQALAVLQSIPSKQRKTKINMALAKLYHQMGNTIQAISAYNKVLKVNRF
jgi:anaphase-promoting complex subunit 7